MHMARLLVAVKVGGRRDRGTVRTIVAVRPYVLVRTVVVPDVVGADVVGDRDAVVVSTVATREPVPLLRQPVEPHVLPHLFPFCVKVEIIKQRSVRLVLLEHIQDEPALARLNFLRVPRVGHRLFVALHETDVPLGI